MKSIVGKSDSAGTAFKCVYLTSLHIQPYFYTINIKTK